MIVNLTPHPLHLYPWHTPDRIKPGSVAATRIIAPSDQYPPARLGHTAIGTGFVDDGVEIEDVEFGADTAHADGLPEPVSGMWFVVCLVVALAATHRSDLLVPHGYVRDDLDGSVIGSRTLGCPVRPEPTETDTCPISATAPLSTTGR
jgi:hypothetical protein